MSFAKLPHSSAAPDLNNKRSSSASPARPKFNSHRTCDRLREGSSFPPTAFAMASKLKKDRKSIFKEVGLDDDFSDDSAPSSPVPAHPYRGSISTSHDKELETGRRDSHYNATTSKDEDRVSDPDEHSPTRESFQQRRSSRPWYARLSPGQRRPRVKTASSAPPPTVSSLQRLAMIALLIAVVFPAFSYNNGRQTVQINGADAGVIARRDTSPVNVCTRWSHQGQSAGAVPQAPNTMC